MTQKKQKILFLIQLPPPVHGVSAMNRKIFTHQYISDNFDIDLLEIKFSSSLKQLRKFNLLKLFFFIVLTLKLIGRLIFKKPVYVYFSFMPVGKGFFRDFIFVSIIKFFNTKPILHIHNLGIQKKSKSIIYRTLYKSCFNNVQIIHLSEKLIKSEFQYLKVRNVIFHYLPNTVVEFLSKKKKSEHDPLKILFFSNLIPEKGLHVLLNALNNLKKEKIKFRLDAYGQIFRKGYKKKILTQIIELNLKGMVKLHKPVYGKDKEQVFNNADIFVFPSYFSEECMPLEILEAMQAELPIIASNIGAIPEMIDNNFSGILVNKNNCHILSQELRLLMTEKKTREKLGYNAKKKFNDSFSEKNFDIAFSKIFSQFRK